MNGSTTSIKQIISDYFRRVGVPEPMKPDAFWKRLEKKHGRAGRDFVLAVNQRAEGLMDVDPYAFKNATEALSLDVTGQYESRLYRDFADWLLNEFDEPPASILDLGCGNGVLTCLLATFYPASRIIGIDSNAAGIEIARSLSSHLQLSNVEFVVGDMTALDDHLSGQVFDAIIAVKSIHEVLNEPELKAITGHSITALNAAPPNNHDTHLLAGVRAHLRSDSRLICVDRWSTAQSFGWWIRTAESAGLRVSLDSSYILKSSEAGTPDTFPISVFSSDTTRPCPSDEQLLSFFVYPELNNLFSKIGVTEGAMAEALFTSLGAPKIISSYDAIYRDGSGAESSRLFVSGAIAGIYSSWTTGLRRLYLGPAVAIRSMFFEFLNRASDFEGPCEVDHHEHDDNGTLLAQFGIQVAG